MRRNPILSIPPAGSHGLGVAGGRRFRSVVGRAPTKEDYYGVHTTSDEVIAGSYAFGTSENDERKYEESYPVIVELDTRGLRALPDVDAMAEGLEAFGDRETIKMVRRYMEEGKDPFSIAEYMDMDQQGSGVVGEHPINVYMEDRFSNPVRAIMAAFEKSPKKIDRVFADWVTRGRVPDQALIALVDQSRYLHDFDMDRVLRIVAVKRWWDRVFDTYWDMDDEELTAQAEAIEAAGYQLVTVEDFDGGGLGLTTKFIYDSGRKTRGEYHGTSSVRLQEALLEVKFPPDPFPVQEVED